MRMNDVGNTCALLQAQVGDARYNRTNRSYDLCTKPCNQAVTFAPGCAAKLLRLRKAVQPSCYFSTRLFYQVVTCVETGCNVRGCF